MINNIEKTEEIIAKRKKELKRVYKIVIGLIILQLVTFVVGLNILDNKLEGIDYDPVHMNKTYGEIEFVRQSIYDNFYKDVYTEQMDRIVIETMFEGLGDTYSYYREPRDYDLFKRVMEGKPRGIGIKISYVEDYTIDYVYPGSTAYDNDIRHGDVITQIYDIDTTEYIGNPFDLISSNLGDTVPITILRDGEHLEKELVVQDIEVDSVMSEKIDNTGYIYITEFAFGTAKEFKEHLSKLNNIDHLIVDVRNNSGGSTSDATKILGMLGIDGTVATLQYREGTFDYKAKASKLDIPITVLINEYTASASEIVAHNITHNGGKSIGETTYGKGLAQNMLESPSGSGVVITVAETILPGDTYIDEVGLTPDIHIEQDYRNIYAYTRDMDSDIQLQEALKR